ncbi:hypothetical protein BGX29_009810 [Mortierella sp. GBA35]|nr:hypothetical protein BGX29_009810 [Mortierella sp. GBA35]
MNIIDFDTGSSRFILSSKGCVECSGTTRFDPTASSTFHLYTDDTTINTFTIPSSNSNNINDTTVTSTPGYFSPSTPSTTTMTMTTANNPNAWHITYGDMSHAEEFLGRDHVTLGSIGSSSGGGGKGSDKGLTIRNQELALVTSESANFDDAIDGNMGLAFGALSSPSNGTPDGSGGSGIPSTAGTTGTMGARGTRQTTRTVFENMMSQGLVDQGVFSFFLGKESRGGGGEVLFGGWDPDRIAEGSELVFTSVTRTKYWQINVENVFVAGTWVEYSAVRTTTWLTPSPGNSNNNKGDTSTIGSIGSTKEKRSNIPGIMDTGTTLMITPFRLANAIHHLIPGAQIIGQSWALPCTLGHTHPSQTVDLQIEGHRFSIPFEDMVREPVERHNGLASVDDDLSSSSASEGDEVVGGVKKGSGLCFSGAQPSGANFMIIGDVFIKNNYVDFDQQYHRVGIAPLKLSPLPLPVAAATVAVCGGEDGGGGEKVKEKEKREVRMRMGWEVLGPIIESEGQDEMEARIEGVHAGANSPIGALAEKS